MTTNNPTTYFAPSTALAKLESRHNNAPCILTDGPAEFNDVALVRLSDYERLQADHERLQAECEELRKDAEVGRSVLSKREHGQVYGCHCDLEEGMEPDGCVIDSGERHNCVYARRIETKEQCEYWRVIAIDTAMQGDNDGR